MTDAPPQLTIRSQADLQRAWRRLMGPWSFGEASVWLMLIDGYTPASPLIEITEAGDPPSGADAGGFAEFLRMVVDDVAPGARAAFLRARPGLGSLTSDDRGWAQTLHAACARAGVPCEVVHVATRGAITPVPWDELVGRAGLSEAG